jgi:DNA-directed RNA polymerase subunit E"
MQRACKKCNYISEESMCPLDGEPTSKNWSGFLSVMEPEKSELAEAMEITKPGNYALKVR